MVLPIGKYVRHTGQPGELTMSHLCSRAKPIRFYSFCRSSAVAAASRVASGGWWQRTATVQVSLFSHAHTHTYRQKGRCVSSYYSRVRFCRCQWFQSETDGTVHVMSRLYVHSEKYMDFLCSGYLSTGGAKFCRVSPLSIHKHSQTYHWWIYTFKVKSSQPLLKISLYFGKK